MAGIGGIATPYRMRSRSPPIRSHDNADAHPTHAKTEPGNGARHARTVASAEGKSLIAEVDNLVARLTAIGDSDHLRLRDQVHNTLVEARDSLMDRTRAMRHRVRDAAGSTDGYVHASPWQALGIAALVAASVGYLAGRRRQQPQPERPAVVLRHRPLIIRGDPP